MLMPPELNVARAIFTAIIYFGTFLALGFALLYLGLIVLIPLSAVFLKTFTLTWSAFWETVASPRVMASYRLTFGASLQFRQRANDFENPESQPCAEAKLSQWYA